jgi:hypothetical protein
LSGVLGRLVNPGLSVTCADFLVDCLVDIQWSFCNNSMELCGTFFDCESSVEKGVLVWCMLFDSMWLSHCV